MRKMVFGRQLSRGRKAREALFRSQIKALLSNGKIVTTKAKVKAIQGDLDKLVSFTKENSLAARRRASSFLGNDRKLTEVLFGKVAKAFSSRVSGFSRIILLPRRKGDMAEMARLEWVEKIDLTEKKEVKKEEKEPKGKIVKEAKIVKKVNKKK